MKKSLFLVGFLVAFRFSLPSFAGCREELEALTPLFSAAEQNEITILESYRSDLVTESQRALYADNFTDEEIREIQVRDAIPLFVDKKDIVKVYSSHIGFLLKGLEKKIGIMFIDRVLSRVDSNAVLELTNQKLKSWQLLFPAQVEPTKEKLKGLIDTMALHSEFRHFNEENLSEMLSLKILLNLKSQLNSDKGGASSDLSILTSAVKEKDEKQILFTIRQNSSHLLVAPPEGQNIIAFIEPQLVQLKNRIDQIETWSKQLDGEIIGYGTKFSLIDPNSQINIFGQVYSRMIENDHEANTCCGRGCSGCTYRTGTRLKIDIETSKLFKINLAPLTDLTTDQTKLAYYRAKRDLAPYLPDGLFKLHDNPKNLQQVLDTIH